MNTYTINVVINKIEYLLVTDEEDSYLVEAADFINKKYAELNNQGIHDPLKVATLIALQCVNQKLQNEKNQKKLLAKTEQVSDIIFSV